MSIRFSRKWSYTESDAVTEREVHFNSTKTATIRSPFRGGAVSSSTATGTDGSSRGDRDRRCGCKAGWIEGEGGVGHQQLRQRKNRRNGNEYVPENSPVV